MVRHKLAYRASSTTSAFRPRNVARVKPPRQDRSSTRAELRTQNSGLEPGACLALLGLVALLASQFCLPGSPPYGRTTLSMTDALYDDLRDAVRAVCVHLDSLPHESAPLGVAWHPWARAFLAGLYARKTTLWALEAARPETLLDGVTDTVAVLSRGAASAAATAVLNAIDGNDTRAREVARITRAIAESLAAQLAAQPYAGTR